MNKTWSLCQARRTNAWTLLGGQRSAWRQPSSSSAAMRLHARPGAPNAGRRDGRSQAPRTSGCGSSCEATKIPDWAYSLVQRVTRPSLTNRSAFCKRFPVLGQPRSARPRSLPNCEARTPVFELRTSLDPSSCCDKPRQITKVP